VATLPDPSEATMRRAISRLFTVALYCGDRCRSSAGSIVGPFPVPPTRENGEGQGMNETTLPPAPPRPAPPARRRAWTVGLALLVVLAGFGDVYLATRLVRSNDHVASLEDALDRSRADAQSARSELTGTKSRLDTANAQLTQTRGKLNVAETKLAACHRAVSRYLVERRKASAAGKAFFTPTRTTIRRIVSCFFRSAQTG
jgi:hypothetical protein